jgi:FtsH-binding integral membrane protein
MKKIYWFFVLMLAVLLIFQVFFSNLLSEQNLFYEKRIGDVAAVMVILILIYIKVIKKDRKF